MGHSNWYYIMRTNYITLFVLMVMVLSSHLLSAQSPDGVQDGAKDHNILQNITKDSLGDLQWLNQPADFNLDQGKLTIAAPKGSDFFINPEDLSATNSAPVLYQVISGDFVASTSVSPDLSSVWNAAGLMLIIDDSNWIKLVFEVSDATGPSIVSVTTRGISDDANGVRLTSHAKIWLKLVRKGNNFAMLWSENGKSYKMARLSAMPPTERVKIGLEAQCPVGEKALHKFHHFSIESKSVKDLRKGE